MEPRVLDGFFQRGGFPLVVTARIDDCYRTAFVGNEVAVGF